MGDKIFSEEQIKRLNEQQQSRHVHPYTCDRSSVNCEVRFNEGDGILIATDEGWVCPCGNYKQHWFHNLERHDVLVINQTIYTSCCKCSTAYQHENAAPFWHTWTCEKCGQVNHSISGNFTNETIEDKLNRGHNNEIQS